MALYRARSLEDVYLLGKLSMADIHRCEPSPNDLKYVAKIHDAARKTARRSSSCWRFSRSESFSQTNSSTKPPAGRFRGSRSRPEGESFI